MGQQAVSYNTLDTSAKGGGVAGTVARRVTGLSRVERRSNQLSIRGIWDAPEFNLLIAEVDRETLAPDRLKEFLLSSIVKADSGLERPKVWLWMERNPNQLGLQGVGLVAYHNRPASAMAKGYEFDLAFISTSNGAYITYKIGKLAPVAK
jgi:hypothetical protein